MIGKSATLFKRDHCLINPTGLDYIVTQQVLMHSNKLHNQTDLEIFLTSWVLIKPLHSVQINFEYT